MANHISGVRGGVTLLVVPQMIGADGKPRKELLLEDGLHMTPAGYKIWNVAPGRYAIRIRAVGYDLDGPKAVEIGAGKTATADLELRKAANIAGQLTDAEWLASIPGTANQKQQLLGCTNCHTLERTLRSTHDAEAFTGVLERMASYANQSFPLHPQKRVSAPNLTRRFGAGTEDLAKYLASVNLSSG